MKCIRCGSEKNIEFHHIIQKVNGGSNNPENLETRCQGCHDYEHSKRIINEKIKRHCQPERLLAWKHRLDVLEALNTIELIRVRGFKPYWSDPTTHNMPRIHETLLQRMGVSEAQERLWDKELDAMHIE
jgi:hypothetical protein